MLSEPARRRCAAMARHPLRMRFFAGKLRRSVSEGAWRREKNWDRTFSA
jgi:hypothetical protein